MGKKRGGTLIHALEKRLRERERERENGSRRAMPLNLLKITLYGLASSYLHLFPFFSHLRGHTLDPSVHALCVYMQRQKKQGSRQAKKETKEIGRAWKEHTN